MKPHQPGNKLVISPVLVEGLIKKSYRMIEDVVMRVRQFLFLDMFEDSGTFELILFSHS